MADSRWGSEDKARRQVGGLNTSITGGVIMNITIVKWYGRKGERNDE